MTNDILQGRRLGRRATQAAQIGLLLLCVALTLYAYRSTLRSIEARVFTAFEVITDDNREALRGRFAGYYRSLTGLAGLFSASREVTLPEIRNFVAGHDIARSLPGSSGLGFIQPVARDRLDAFRQEARTVGIDALSVHPDTGGGELFVVKFIEPDVTEPELRGLDIASDPEQRAAAIRARDTGEPQLTPPFVFERNGRPESEFLLLVPVYRNGAAPETEAERRATFIGWTFAPISASQALAELTASQHALFELTVFDGSAPPTHAPVFSTAGPGFDPAEAGYRRSDRIDLFGRVWTLNWASTPQFDASHAHFTGVLVLFGGGLLTLLAALLFRVLNRREQAIRRQVVAQTRALQASEEENRAIVEYADTAILTLEGGERIVRCNHAGLAKLGLDAERVLGRSVREVLPGLDMDGAMDTLRYTPPQDGAEPRIFRWVASDWTTAAGEPRTTLILHEITQQAKLFDHIAQTERRYDLALQGGEIGVFDLNLQTGSSIVSDTWKRLMGVPADELDFEPQAVFLSRIHPEDLPRLKAADEACIRGETERSICEYRMNVPGRGWRWMRSDAVVVEQSEDGRPLRLIGTQSDVTEEREAQAKLKSSEERFRLILSNAPVGKAVLDSEGRFTVVNDALTDLLGYGEDELLGRVSGRDLLAYEDYKELLERTDAQRRGGGTAIQAEKEMIRKDGSKFWGLMNLSWTNDARTQEDIFIVQVSDITEKKQMEQMKSSFVSTVSHELRTPLTSIRGALALLDRLMEKEERDPKVLRYFEIAQSNTNRLIALVNDILDVERIESGRMKFVYSEQSLSDVLADTREALLPYAELHGVALEFASPDFDCTLLADKNRLAQVFDNLISNACKFSEKGDTVTVTAECGEANVLFHIQDQGAGIPASFFPNIFKPFSQADSTDTREKGGTGLGLNICKRIVERMGGEIGFESEEGAGTRFWFTCPLAANTNKAGAEVITLHG